MQAGAGLDVLAGRRAELLVLCGHCLPLRGAGRDRSLGRLEQQRNPIAALQWLCGQTRPGHRPHLNRTVLGGRDSTGQFEYLIEVLGFEYVVSARDLGAFGERAVGNDRRIRAPVICAASAAGSSASPPRIAEAAWTWNAS
ncbi:hypothetical protein MSHO_27560 [Mycobacterium shottsii]|uniref:Uncharacterized protein n=1 Tax=Mycobacterium shottsii TaxID=133549 RepID=A0A7I7LBJ4_9MYCO|nr:hypothetical protein MSHO_27560 [Mycobacterium shottsii]